MEAVGGQQDEREEQVRANYIVNLSQKNIVAFDYFRQAVKLQSRTIEQRVNCAFHNQ